MHEQSSNTGQSPGSDAPAGDPPADGVKDVDERPEPQDASHGSPRLNDREIVRDPIAAALGRRGGLKGGRARAEQLSPERRRAIAQRAAQARWGTRPAEPPATPEPDRPKDPGQDISPVAEPTHESEPAPPRPPWAPRRLRPESDEGTLWAEADRDEIDPGRTEREEEPSPAQGFVELIGPALTPDGRPDLPVVPGSESPLQLQLADWRRRIFDLYGEVRQQAGADPERAWRRWRDVREALYRRHPMSPLPEGRREDFRASHFDYDPGLRFDVAIRPDPFGRGHDVGGPSSAVFLPNSGPEMLSFDRVGWLDVPLPSGIQRLSLFWLTGYGGGLFLPFRDGTNGTATYGAGRYLLDTAKGADLGGGSVPGTLVIDFNFAYQPSCAFDPRWACPLAPPENRLEVSIPAGERI